MRLFRQLCLEKGSLMLSVLLLCNETEQAESGVFPSKGLWGIWPWAGDRSWPEGISSEGPSSLAWQAQRGQSWKEPCLLRAERGSGLCTPSAAPHTLPGPSAPLGAAWYHGLAHTEPPLGIFLWGQSVPGAQGCQFLNLMLQLENKLLLMTSSNAGF